MKPRDRVWCDMAALVMDHMGDYRRKVSEATGLPFSRFRALRRVATPLTLKELAESMGTDAPAATVIVNALEDEGLVKREPHPDDRRAKVVSLTPAGKKLVATGQAVDEEAPAMFDGLRDADVAELTRIIGILRTSNR